MGTLRFTPRLLLWAQVVIGGLRDATGAPVYYASDGQGLESIPDDIPHDIETISLRRNSFFQVDVFPLFPKLTKLLLAENQLEEFPNLVNVSLTLEELDLGKNRIGYVNPDMLAHLAVLKILDLKHNHLQYFSDISDLQTSSLEQLKLDFSFLHDFPFLPRMGQNILSLTIAGNYIGQINEAHMAVLPKLITFTADNNPLQSMPGLNPVGSTLEILTLQNCGLRQVSTEDLAPMQKLKFVNLHGNYLEEVPDFRQSPSKTTLLSIYLSYNRISRINLDHLSGMPALFSVVAPSNRLQTQPNWCRLTKLPSFIDVLGSDVSCDRRLRWTIRAKSSGMGILQENIYRPCKTPDSLAAQLFAGIPESDLGDTGRFAMLIQVYLVSEVRVSFEHDILHGG